jgi:transglutaminase-like putative cysteine protease
MQLSVVHRTILDYDDEIADTTMEMRLRPRDEAGQRVLSYELLVDPRGPIRSYHDAFGNEVQVYNYRPPHKQVVVEARSVVLTSPTALTPEATLNDGERFRLLRFDGPVTGGPALREVVSSAANPDLPGVATPELLSSLAGLVHDRLVYEPNVTSVESTVAEVLELGRGVCQDFAHLWIACCRALAIPARYVSGYIWNGDERQEQASHAWGEAWVPGTGWLAYDPTNYRLQSGGRAGEHHVRIAVGRDYRDVPPTRGVFRGAARETLSVDVRVLQVSGVQEALRA